MVDRQDRQETVNKPKPHCDRCGKVVESPSELFRLDAECIASIFEEIHLLRTANEILRHELQEKYGIVKTIYH